MPDAARIVFPQLQPDGPDLETGDAANTDSDGGSDSEDEDARPING